MKYSVFRGDHFIYTIVLNVFALFRRSAAFGPQEFHSNLYIDLCLEFSILLLFISKLCNGHQGWDG